MPSNKLNLSVKGNDALREKIASISPGDEIEMEITVRLDESNGDQVQFSVVEANVIDEDSSSEDTESDDGEGEGEDGMMNMNTEPLPADKEEEGKAAALLVFGKGAKKAK